MRQTTKCLRVYVVMWWSPVEEEDSRIEGVYATREDAEKYIVRQRDAPCRYSVLEFPLRSSHKQDIVVRSQKMSESKTQSKFYPIYDHCTQSFDSTWEAIKTQAREKAKSQVETLCKSINSNREGNNNE